MEKLYNAKLSFKGDGNFTFMLPSYGELTIFNGRDIFVKGLSVAGVEALRQLRPLLLEHQLNAKPDGCYKVIDLTTTATQPRLQERKIKEIATMSVADLKNSLIKSNGPIPTDDEKDKEPELTEPEDKEPEANNIDDEVNRIKKELEENEGKKEEDLQAESKEDKKGKAKQKTRQPRKNKKK